MWFWITTPRTYSGSPHVGRMRKVHVVEQEKDGVQGVVLLRLAFLPCSEIENIIKIEIIPPKKKKKKPQVFIITNGRGSWASTLILTRVTVETKPDGLRSDIKNVIFSPSDKGNKSALSDAWYGLWQTHTKTNFQKLAGSHLTGVLFCHNRRDE